MTFGELFLNIEDDNSDGEHLRDLLRAMLTVVMKLHRDLLQDRIELKVPRRPMI